MGWLTRQLLSISPDETTVQRRGFHVSGPATTVRIESIGRSFALGYHAALESEQSDQFVPKLEQVEHDLKGFAYEGAGMALALLDHLTPWPWQGNRVERFVSDLGSPYTYLVHVGVGWALARWPGRIEPAMRRLDPLLRSLAIDGYGFHEGFFHWRNYSRNQSIPQRIQGDARRTFDQGLGRSLWFVQGASVIRVSETIQQLAPERRSDLWSGIGLASVYAGDSNSAELHELLHTSGKYYSHLAQGAAFAAKARVRAGNATAHTDRACGILCRLSAAEAAALTDSALPQVRRHQSESAYERWRTNIRSHFE